LEFTKKRTLVLRLKVWCFIGFFTTEKGGTGLGLYVARELAHANLGQLHYHPELNGFELILPKDNNHEE